MIDPGKLQNAQDSESFDDSPQNNDAFQLESLPTYPGDLPFNPDDDASKEPAQQLPTTSGSDQGPSEDRQSSTTQDSEASAAEADLKATLEAELARSQAKKSKKDTLEESINRLKEKLNPSESSSSIAASDDLVDDFNADSYSAVAAPESQVSNVDFEELPVELPASIGQAASLDDSVVDSMQSSNLMDNNAASLPSAEDVAASSDPMPSIVDEAVTETPVVEAQLGRPINKRFIYAMVGGLAIIAATAAGIWWKLHTPASHGAQDSVHIAQNGPQPEHVHGEALTPQGSGHDSTHEAAHDSSHEASKDTAAHHEHETSHTATEGAHNASTEHHSEHATAHGSSGTAVAEHAKDDTKSKKENNHASPTQKPVEHGTAHTSQSPAPAHGSSSAVIKAPTGHTASSANTAHAQEKPDIKSQSVKAPASLATASHAEHATDKNANLRTTPKQSKENSVHSGTQKPEVIDRVVKPRTPQGPESQSIAKANKEGVDKEKQDRKKPAKDHEPVVEPPKVPTGTVTNTPPKTVGTVASSSPHDNAPEPRMVAKPIVKSAPISSRAQYTVQVYSSPSRDDAEEWMKKLSKKNIGASSLSMQQVRGTTYYRVRFGSYDTKAAADSAAISSGFASSWVDRVK